jgi:hypothetical protein
MFMKKKVILLCCFLSILIHCGHNNPTTAPTVVASETWHCTDVSTSNYINIILSKMSSGDVTAQGMFIYDFYGDTITGTISSGSATIVDTTVAINTQGTASYPPSQTGPHSSSPFSLQMAGAFKDSVSHGTWNIQFSDSLWQGLISPGQFTGRLQSGSGVTVLH